MAVADLIRALRVIDDALPVTERTRQGWRASITSSTTDRKQLCEIHAQEASVLTVSFDVSAGANVDDGGIIIAETRIGEALRTRSFFARRQGFALNVPAGITRVFCQGFTKPYTAFVQMAPGITTTERLGNIVTIPIGGTNVQATPSYARLVKVTVLQGSIAVTVPGGVVTLIIPPGSEPQSVEMPAYQDTAVSETTGINAATFAIEWEVTA